LVKVENSARKIAGVDCAHYGGNGLNANGRNTNRHWFEAFSPRTAR
jgi:hypothetical protein